MRCCPGSVQYRFNPGNMCSRSYRSYRSYRSCRSFRSYRSCRSGMYSSLPGGSVCHEVGIDYLSKVCETIGMVLFGVALPAFCHALRCYYFSPALATSDLLHGEPKPRSMFMISQCSSYIVNESPDSNFLVVFVLICLPR